MNFSTEFMYYMDLFKISFPFSIEKRRKFWTIEGFLLSLIIFGYLIFMITSSNMIEKINPIVINQSSPKSSSPRLHMTNPNNSLDAGIGLADPLSGRIFFDPTIYIIEGAIMKFTTNNITNQKETELVEFKTMRPCTENDFQDREVFGKGAKGTFCMNNKSLEIEGSMIDEEAQVLFLQMRVCNNLTENILNITCKPIEKIKSILKTLIPVFGYSEYYFDVKDYEDPVKRFYRLSSFNKLDLSLQVNKWISLKKIELIDDDNPLFLDLKVRESFTYEEDNDFITVKNIEELNSFQNPFMRFVIMSARKEETTTRRYQKLSELLANLSGVINFLLIIIGLFLNNVSQIRMKNYLLNYLFSFANYQSNEKKSSSHSFNKNLPQVKSQITLNKMNEIIERNVELKNRNAEFEERNSGRPPQIETQHEEILFETEKEIYDDFAVNIDKFIEKQKKKKKERFNYRVIDSLIIFFKNFFARKLNSNEFIKEKSEEILEQQSDVNYILKKINEIEKIKSIIMNENQLMLFNLLSKPIICCESDNKNLMSLKTNIQGLNIYSNEKKIKLDKINQIKEYLFTKNNEGKLDQIDNNLVKIIKNSNNLLEN